MSVLPDSLIADEPPIWEDDFGEVLGALSDGDESDSTAITLPFAFPFDGETYTTIWVYVGGVISLGAEDDLACCPDPNDVIDADVPLIGPFWTNLSTEEGGDVHYNQLDNRVVMTWNEVVSDAEEDFDYTFQVQLFDNGVIIFAFGEDIFISEGTLNSDLIVGMSDASGEAVSATEFFDLPLSTATATVYDYNGEDDNVFGYSEQSILFVPNEQNGFLITDVTFTVDYLYPHSIPVQIASDTDSFTFSIGPLYAQLFQPDSGVLHYNISDDFEETPIAPMDEDGTFTVEFPAFPFSCGEIVEFYLSFETIYGDTIIRPIGAPDEPYLAIIDETGDNIIFSDTFETDMGWTAENDASSNFQEARWQRGVPTPGGGDTHPDQDADGSGQLYITGLLPSELTFPNAMYKLTSPVIDASDPDAWLLFHQWVHLGVPGLAKPEEAFFRVEFSSNGGDTWETVKMQIGDDPLTGGGWNFQGFQISDFVTPTDEFRVRFTVKASNPTSGTKAAIDGVQVVSFSSNSAQCPSTPAGDINQDGIINGADLGILLGFFGPCPDSNAPCTFADLNNDGTVDGADLGLLLGNFGAGGGG